MLTSNVRLEATKRMEDIAAKRATREALEGQAFTPPNMDPVKHRSTAEWAALQAKPVSSHNPRLAAGHPNAQPLRNAYVEDDDSSQVSLSDSDVMCTL